MWREDWSNDAENSALITAKKIHFNIHLQLSNSYFQSLILIGQ